MCTEALVRKHGTEVECETLGELSVATGLKLTTLVDYSDPKPDDCLCNVLWDDIGARRATEKEGWPFVEYIIEPPNNQGNRSEPA